mmetsp:Transcript_14769/g.45081  ORF Transcript_14769/g.45081 Transcript_14769/m.45081 type:complete len:103 (+) Transcript_14769:1082-1390(+)
MVRDVPVLFMMSSLLHPCCYLLLRRAALASSGDHVCARPVAPQASRLAIAGPLLAVCPTVRTRQALLTAAADKMCCEEATHISTLPSNMNYNYARAICLARM